MIDKKYYWLCSYLLEEGAVVLPGNWGRMVKLYTSQNNVFIYLREELFEKIRKSKYPDLPSRMTSIFLCEDLDILIKFRNESGRNFDICYEIEILDEKPVFEADWTLTNFPPEPFQIGVFETKADLYWSSSNVQSKEILTESRIKIVKRIE